MSDRKYSDDFLPKPVLDTREYKEISISSLSEISIGEQKNTIRQIIIHIQNFDLHKNYIPTEVILRGYSFYVYFQYQFQRYDILTLLANQAKIMLLAKFKSISFDLKDILG